MARIKRIIKNLGLPISMLIGVLAYFIFEAIPLTTGQHEAGYAVLSGYIQPVLIFLMLWLSFMKVRIHEMKPQWWHLWVLLLQAGCFIVCTVFAINVHSHGLKILFEGAMLAFICPTATAASVVTGKLGGSVSGVVTYLMLCNLMVSLLAPALLPLVEPSLGLSFFPSFLMILRKVFPLLICPLLLAMLVRYCLPRVHKAVMRYPDLAFQLWMVALALAIMVTVRSIVLSTVEWQYMFALAIIGAVCCFAQFALGKWIGKRCAAASDADSLRTTAGQAFGQKNTVFAIWMGLTFLDPVTSVMGGFYSVWHNLVNAWQLAERGKK